MEPRSGSTRAVGVLAVLLVAGVAGLSLASSLVGEGGGADEPPGGSTSATAPASTTAAVTSGPAIGSLAALPPPERGRFLRRLALMDADCGLAELDLVTLRTRVLASDVPGCDAILSADGDAGLFPGRPGAAVEAFVIWPDGVAPTGPGPPLGPAGYGPPAVSDEGAIAVCSTGPESNRPQVTLQLPGRGAVRRVPGCRPVFAGERLLVALREGTAAIRDGETGAVVARRDALPRRTRGDLLLGVDAGGGLVGVIGRTESLDHVDLAIFGLDGELRGTWRDVHTGSDLRTLRLASTAQAAALDVNGVWRLLALRPDGSFDAVETVAGARILDVDFAPNGRWAAVLVDGAIVFVDATTLGPVAAVPVDARSVRWLP